MDVKNDISKKIYQDKSGFGSIKTTFDDARKVDKTITLDDVKNFFKGNVDVKKKLKGMNSFVAPYPYYEFQLVFFS